MFSTSSAESSRRDPSDPERLIRRLAVVMVSGISLLVLSLIGPPANLVWSQAVPTSGWLGPVSTLQVPSEVETPSSAPALVDRASHPSEKLVPYFAPSVPTTSVNAGEVLREFHELLDQYVQRQTQDDNFTIRVLDRRTNEVLERYELEKLRTAYDQGKALSWRNVDQHRRKAMERLVDKYEERGIPLEDIIVRWGRANQIEEAHERDRAYRTYELRLAESLGLSQLAMEIGTVETFNQDHLVSTAGARSRYQMLPWIMRRSGVNEYTLPTKERGWVRVQESLHPLLVLEPAFVLLRGYVNAVGHEMPGLSAYHAGPGNIFKLYRQYYHKSGHFISSSTVADAYAWAVTEGFDTVSENSSFGGDSRGYVPALYGSLKAHEDHPIASSSPLRAVRLQLKPHTSLTVRELLTALESASHSVDWGPTANEGSLYERFRALNPHFDLPPSSGEGVPATGNVQLLSSVDGKAVHFFLPLRAPAALRSTGLTVLDSTASFRFDSSTFTGPSPRQITRWDRRYRSLVNDIEHFGFTEQNRERLLALHDRFESLAEETPTRYRRRQLQIIRTHRRLWLSNPWEELAQETEEARQSMPVRIQPPEVIGNRDLDFRDLGSLPVL